MAQVLSFKLITGQEVVAEIADKKTSSILMESGSRDTRDVIEYVLRRPHVLEFQPVGPGQIGLAFVPWTLSNPELESVSIPANMIISVFSPSEKVERQYLQQTSGISIASTGGMQL